MDASCQAVIAGALNFLMTSSTKLHTRHLLQAVRCTTAPTKNIRSELTNPSMYDNPTAINYCREVKKAPFHQRPGCLIPCLLHLARIISGVCKQSCAGDQASSIRIYTDNLFALKLQWVSHIKRILNPLSQTHSYYSCANLCSRFPWFFLIFEVELNGQSNACTTWTCRYKWDIKLTNAISDRYAIR